MRKSSLLLFLLGLTSASPAQQTAYNKLLDLRQADASILSEMQEGGGAAIGLSLSVKGNDYVKSIASAIMGYRTSIATLASLISSGSRGSAWASRNTSGADWDALSSYKSEVGTDFGETSLAATYYASAATMRVSFAIGVMNVMKELGGVSGRKLRQLVVQSVDDLDTYASGVRGQAGDTLRNTSSSLRNILDSAFEGVSDSDEIISGSSSAGGGNSGSGSGSLSAGGSSVTAPKRDAWEDIYRVLRGRFPDRFQDVTKPDAISPEGIPAFIDFTKKKGELPLPLTPDVEPLPAPVNQPSWPEFQRILPNVNSPSIGVLGNDDNQPGEGLFSRAWTKVKNLATATLGSVSDGIRSVLQRIADRIDPASMLIDRATEKGLLKNTNSRFLDRATQITGSQMSDDEFFNGGVLRRLAWNVAPGYGSRAVHGINSFGNELVNRFGRWFGASYEEISSPQEFFTELALTGCSTVAKTEQQLSAKLCNRRGIECISAGNFGGSEQWFKKAIEVDPEAPSAYFNVALVYDAKEQFLEAITNYKSYLERGKDTRLRKLAESAIARLAKEAEEDKTPDGKAARLYRTKMQHARLFAEGGEYRVALSEMAAASALRPTEFEPFALGILLACEVGDFELANDFLVKAKQLAGSSHVQQVKVLETAIAEDLTIYQLRKEVSNRLESKDAAGAVARIDELVKVLPSRPEVLLLKARTLLYLSDAKSAKSVLSEVVAFGKEPFMNQALIHLEELSEVEKLSELLQDESVKHPELGVIQDRVMSIRRELGLHDELAGGWDQTYDNILAQAQLAVDQSTSNLGAGLALLAKIAAEEERRKKTRKLDELRGLLERHKEISAMPRPFSVALHAIESQNFDIAELALNLVQDSKWDTDVSRALAKCFALQERFEEASSAYKSTYEFEDFPYILEARCRAGQVEDVVQLWKVNYEEYYEYCKSRKSLAKYDSTLISIQDWLVVEDIDIMIASTKLSLKANGNDPWVRRLLAYALRIGGKPKEAAKEVRQAVEHFNKWNAPKQWFEVWLNYAIRASDAKSAAEAIRRAGDKGHTITAFPVLDLAYAKSDWKAALTEVEKLCASVNDPHPVLSPAKTALLLRMSEAKAYEYLGSLLDTDCTDAGLYNTLAWMVISKVDPKNGQTLKLEPPDYAIVMKLAIRASELSGGIDSHIEDTLAHATYLSGKKGRAVELQKRVLALAAHFPRAVTWMSLQNMKSALKKFESSP